MKIVEKLLSRKKETELVVVEDTNQVVVSVPDIKEYLVKEYERAETMMLKIEGLEEQLEKSNETKLKYDATLVTLDEYSKRLRQAETMLEREKSRTESARQEVLSMKDVVNSYKIQLNNAALTKEEIKDEITSEVKSQIIQKINSHKGNLSKKIVCEIIEGVDAE